MEGVAVSEKPVSKFILQGHLEDVVLMERPLPFARKRPHSFPAFQTAALLCCDQTALTRSRRPGCVRSLIALARRATMEPFQKSFGFASSLTSASGVGAKINHSKMRSNVPVKPVSSSPRLLIGAEVNTKFHRRGAKHINLAVSEPRRHWCLCAASHKVWHIFTAME